MMQVHDELVFICPEDNVERAKEIIREVMEHPFKRELRLPITVEIADVKYWGDAK
jgi:DNA polymerase-1